MLRIIFLVIVIAGCLMGCNHDILVPYPPRVIGEYNGIYWYQELVDTSETDNGQYFAVNDSQFVLVTIDSQYFWMMLDTRKTPTSDRIACDARANYRLDEIITLWYPDEMTGPRTDPAVTCAENRAPAGAFSILSEQDSVSFVNRTSVDLPQQHRKIELRKVLRLNRE